MLSPVQKSKLNQKLHLRDVGQILDTHEYLVEVDHHEAVTENLQSEYTKYPEVEAIHPYQSQAERAIPDIVLDIPEVEPNVAIEVKVRDEDFHRALFQCRMYALDGFAPYVAVPGKIDSITPELIETTLTEFQGNTPGWLKIGYKNITVERQPIYDHI